MDTTAWIALAGALAEGLGKAFSEVWKICQEQRPELRDVDIDSVAADYTRARDAATKP